MGAPPKGGFAGLVPELLVQNIVTSTTFWCQALGFTIAYQRPEQGFVYLERPESAQIMLCARSGKWETAPLEVPYGRGVLFQVFVADIDPILERLANMAIPLHTARAKSGVAMATAKAANAKSRFSTPMAIC